MSHWFWKIKEFFRMMFPIALLGAFIYGGFILYKGGTFKHGIQPGIQKLISKVPVFGTRFRHSSGHKFTLPSKKSGKSYARSSKGSRKYTVRKKSRRGKAVYRRSKRHGRRR